MYIGLSSFSLLSGTFQGVMPSVKTGLMGSYTSLLLVLYRVLYMPHLYFCMIQVIKAYIHISKTIKLLPRLNFSGN